MKTVKITVTYPPSSGKVPQEIEVTYEGDVMPEELNAFIVAHVGGRPDDRK